MRYFSVYSSECEVIRITGYLVKKSEIQKLNNGEATLQDTVVLGQGQVKNKDKVVMVYGYINKIILFSPVDGPGNRTAIFYKDVILIVYIIIILKL